MIEVVEPLDFEKLEQLLLDSPENRRKAIESIITIIYRLPTPRVYIAEPVYTPGDDKNSLLWELGYDALTARAGEEHFSLIEPETIRLLILYCGALGQVVPITTRNPLLLALISSHAIQELWLPVINEPEDMKAYHLSLARRAGDHGIRVSTWRPRYERAHAS